MKQSNIVVLLTIISCWRFIRCFAKDNANFEYYTAGTVEFNANFEVVSPDRIIENSLKTYLDFIALAKEQNVDILVFPEATLNYHGLNDRQTLLNHAVSIPNPEEKIAPCDHQNDYSEVLYLLSKKSRDNQIYVLVNIVEKVQCNVANRICTHPYKSHKDGYDLFNTNIVFDRRGRIISRYRKYNLFLEPFMDEPLTVELATFTTDFNVQFGHFICFDILFKDPAMRLVRELNVTDILYPAMWYSDLPFLTSEQIHQGWAYANNVNLISSGASNPSVGNTGSGIYLGRTGIADIIMSPTPVSKLLVKRVPKQVQIASPQQYSIPPEARHTPVEMQSLRLIELWTNEDVNKFEITNETQTICVDESSCCTFSIKSKHLEIPVGKIAYKYMLVANYTTRLLGKDRETGEAYCAILACTTNNPKSCGRRFKDNHKLFNAIHFEKITITAKVGFNRQDDILIMPTSLDTSILPLDPNQYTFTESNPYTKSSNLKFQDFTIESKSKLIDLLTFGIYGRNFAIDHFRRHRL